MASLSVVISDPYHVTLSDYAKTNRFTISVAAIAVLPGFAGGLTRRGTGAALRQGRDDIPPAGPAGPGALAVRLPGQGGTGKFLGELVPALCPGNARPCQAATATGGQAVSGSGAGCGRKKIPGQEICQTDQLISFDLPVLLDTTSETFNAWQVETLPTTFLIGADGRIRYRALGDPDWNDPDTIAVVEALLSETVQHPAAPPTSTDTEVN